VSVQTPAALLSIFSGEGISALVGLGEDLVEAIVVGAWMGNVSSFSGGSMSMSFWLVAVESMAALSARGLSSSKESKDLPAASERAYPQDSRKDLVPSQPHPQHVQGLGQA
jgi:hypothetical protein